jgi:Bacterial conjugation TrbI-like protein
MKNEEMSNEAVPSVPQVTESPAPAEEEVSAARTSVLREIFRNALRQARREPMHVRSRKELSRDKSKSMLLLVGLAVVLLLVCLGVLSTPRKVSLPSGRRNQPNLGGRVTPGQEASESGKSITPLLDAGQQPQQAVPGNPVTAEDVGRTARSGDASTLSAPPANSSPTNPKHSSAYALKGIDFSDPLAAKPAAQGQPLSPPDSSELKKPAIVFVRSTESAVPTARSQPALLGQDIPMDVLPAGTRLLARLEAPVSSAEAAPVVAVVEYNYEREGEIVLPAGAKVFGKLVEAHSSGFVDLRFDHIEMPDGLTDEIHATAMDLKFGPLKGHVSGKRSGAKFLVSSLSGVGTAAAYMVGGHSNAAFNGPLSENSLLRERVADNVANAGQGELNQLSLNQNLVVTIPANTRFYLVLEEGGMDSGNPAGRSSTKSAVAELDNSNQLTLEELRELIELRRELSQMYQQSGPQATDAARTPAQ